MKLVHSLPADKSLPFYFSLPINYIPFSPHEFSLPRLLQFAADYQPKAFLAAGRWLMAPLTSSITSDKDPLDVGKIKKNQG